MIKRKSCNHLNTFYILFIALMLFSCKHNYEKDIRGIWRLEKVESVEDGQAKTEENSGFFMYYEFSKVMSLDYVSYNSTLGNRDVFGYTIKDDKLYTQYLNAAIQKEFKLDSVTYNIVALDEKKMILELKIPDNENVKLRYYCIREKNEKLIRESLASQNNEWDFYKFKVKFKEAQKDKYNIGKFPDSIYDNFLRCYYEHVYGDLSPISETDKLKDSFTHEMIEKLKPGVKDCESILSAYRQLHRQRQAAY
jgi:hypothetical protein